MKNSTMKYWLMKSEPSTWSWADQKSKKVTSWDGVRNYQAARNMRMMEVGDLAFFYHSGEERSIKGIVKIVKPYYPDPTDQTGKFGMVDVEYVQEIPNSITLQKIKQTLDLQNLALVRQSRLSVMPIKKKEWNILLKMGGMSV